jgi:hypothetical protein
MANALPVETSCTTILKTRFAYVTEAAMASPGRTENTCLIWLVGYISHHAEYTGVVPEQYASVPLCSTVLSYQPSNPTHWTAARVDVEAGQFTAATVQCAPTLVNGERALTTYPAQLEELRAALALPPVWLVHAASRAADTLAGNVAAADTMETLATESDTPTTVAISPRVGRNDLAAVIVCCARAGALPEP